MTSVSTLVDRGGEGSPVERTSQRPDLLVSAPSTGDSIVREAKGVPLLVENKERVREMRLSISDPAPLRLLGRD